MPPEKPEHDGRFVKKSQVRPAIKVDCSAWGTTEADVPQTVGRFVNKSQARPAIAVDCSGWPETPALSLELTLAPDSPLDAVQLAFGLFDVVSAVNSIDQELGGSGLTKVSGQQSNGAVTITLAPRQQSGAADRIRRICDQVNQPTQARHEFPIPAGVKAITARVA